MPPRSFGPGAVFTPEAAVQRFVIALYYDTTMPKYPQPTNLPRTERNQAIIEAYHSGETLERIAVAYDISIARVHQIVNKQ